MNATIATTTEMTGPVCLECGKRFKGRTDKKFCSDICKNNHHNKNKVSEYQEIKSIFLVIRRNRRVLKKHFTPGKDKPVTRENLLRDGLDFNFHTHFIVTKIHQHEFTFCLDYGYREVEKDKYQVIKSF